MKVKLLLIALILSFGLMLTFAAIKRQSNAQDKPSGATRENRPKPDPNIPIADYAADLPAANAAAQQMRQAKNVFYRREDDRTRLDPGVVNNYPLVTMSHLFVRLPSLPIAESDAVVIGTIKESSAIFTKNMSAIYSEFTFDVERVFKTDTLPVAVGQSFVAERRGGAVRFPSGAVQEFRHYEMQYPRIGGRYLLFLKRETEVNVSIKTGYELLDGKVRPLDDYQAFQVYKDQPESDLIADLTSALEKGVK
jgi:hypothetical protein